MQGDESSAMFEPMVPIACQELTARVVDWNSAWIQTCPRDARPRRRTTHSNSRSVITLRLDGVTRRRERRVTLPSATIRRQSNALRRAVHLKIPWGCSRQLEAATSTSLSASRMSLQVPSTWAALCRGACSRSYARVFQEAQRAALAGSACLGVSSWSSFVKVGFVGTVGGRIQ